MPYIAGYNRNDITGNIHESLSLSSVFIGQPKTKTNKANKVFNKDEMPLEKNHYPKIGKILY